MNAEEAKLRISEIGAFSSKLEEILRFLLKETLEQREHFDHENECRKAELLQKTRQLEDKMEAEVEALRVDIQKEVVERQKDQRELHSRVKQDNVEFRKEVEEMLAAETVRRTRENGLLKEKMEKEKREMCEYLEKDSRETRQKVEADGRVLQERLEREASEIRIKLDKENECRLRENREMHDELARQAEAKEKEMGCLKERLEVERTTQGNEITQMFDRLKAENEMRRSEVHGLKDVLVRESERQSRDVAELRTQLEKEVAALDRGVTECKKAVKVAEEDLAEAIRGQKKEFREKMEAECGDIKRRVELETNDIRDRMQMDKKALINSWEEENDERRREVQLLRAQLHKDRDEVRSQIESDAKVLLQHLEKDSNDILGLLKKERVERERESSAIKDRMERDKQELQISIDKDRDNFVRKLAEEHDMRRLEQMELVQRLDSAEKASAADLQELQMRLRREAETRDAEGDELAAAIKAEKRLVEERLQQESRMLMEEFGSRVERLDAERLHDSQDIQCKVAQLGKSASRHIDNLKHYVFRECQSLFDLATKPCSVVFNCHRDEGYVNGGEDYLTFSGCTVNIGNGMNPKSGEFRCPEGGLYMFLLTCCTYDMKKCLVAIRKNGKDVASLFDQDGDQNKGKTMLGQNVLLELVPGDRVQVYAYTATGLTDTKTSRYTQFLGFLMRPSVDSMHEVVRKMGNTDLMLDSGSSRVNSRAGSVFCDDDNDRSTASTLRSINGRRDSRKLSAARARVGSPLPADNSSQLLVIREQLLAVPPPQTAEKRNGEESKGGSSSRKLLLG